ncbi:uncharacterized protein LOC110720265 [Chenopodium quinoa]|uniref:F-box domain-containing protein n=1 Tax=Chenopodium quinoa TaxID=63459 RepID=A0A803KV90_CHEQI|nr:uncharacterized protein LOC110720265 [Chenopodium quinoa]XP_021754968.1 uncharacterized protein LOC110720265 [Chenopodium quinoa]XP_021754974.1 uncharacterized protein LOC110720265 [Chenopodium quinoa]XP_021754980.1 uncharacterized protein LOC110720265 [Chenopodium quinoa]
MEKTKVEDYWCLPPAERSPYLVYTLRNVCGDDDDDESKPTQTFCTIDEGNDVSDYSYIKSIPQLRGKFICASCHGWLILGDFVDKFLYYLWNPLTLELIALPPLPNSAYTDDEALEIYGDLEKYRAYTLITLGDEDLEKNSVGNNVSVVLLFFDDKVFSYRLSSKSSSDISSNWINHGLELFGKKLTIHNVITVNKVVYAWAHKYYREDIDGPDRSSILLSIEVANDATDSFTIKSLQMDPLPQNGLVSSDKLVDYWVESCGHVYYIWYLVRRCMDCRIRMVKIYELDLVGNKWVEVKSLDGRAFFLGQDCSTWCWGSNSGDGSGCVRGDCIYFPVPKREYFDNTIYYCYSLNEGALSMKLFRSELSRHYAPIWLNLMPQYHSLLGVQDMKGKELTQIKENVDGLDCEMISYSTSYDECHREENKRRGKRPQLSELPLHLIYLISKYMHLFDLWNFRVSCKTFHDAVSQPQHRTNNMLPLFVVLKNDGRSCEIIDPSLDYSCSSILQLSSDPFAIEFFKDGWLVISVDSKTQLKYYNPFSRVSGDFPSDVDIHRFTRIGFSTYPTSPDCVTVAIDNSIPCAVKIYCIKYGDESWDSFMFRRRLNFFFGSSSPIYIAGTFYILDAVGNLGAYILIDGKGSWRVYNRPYIIGNLKRTRAYLVESDGEPHFVCIRDDWGPWVKVFKFNLLQVKWLEVKSLGNHSFFLSHTFSFSVEITKAGMQNRIYLSRLKGNGILFYSLETHKYHVLGTEDSMEHFSGTQEPMQCCWL